MIDLRVEGDDGRLERIIGGEVDREAEDAAVEGRRLGAEDHCLPSEEVIGINGTGRAVRRRVPLNVCIFAL